MKIVYPEKQYETREIGPEQATELLKDHENYRKLSPWTLQKYVRQMNLSQWKSGSILLVDEYGQLADGQHRMQAIIDSGKTYSFDVILGYPADNVDVLDTGKPRSVGTLLTQQGYKDGTRLSSLVRNLMAPVPGGAVPYMNNDILHYTEEYAELCYKVLTIATKREFRAVKYLIVFARALLVLPNRESDILQALTYLVTEDYYKPYMSGFYQYVKWSRKSKTDAGGYATVEHYMRQARALTAYLNAEELKACVRMSTDPFNTKDLV